MYNAGPFCALKPEKMSILSRNQLNQVEVVPTVSGGSVIGGMFVANRDPFPGFEAWVREHLARGFVRPSIPKALTATEGLWAFC